MVNEMKTRDQFTELVAELLNKDNGHDRWCWMRRRAGKHYEESYWSSEDSGGDFGSSDLSNYIYNLWQQYDGSTLDDNFGWWINGEICDLIGIPRTKVTERFHDQERG